MAIHTHETKTPVRGNGDHPMRTMFGNVRPIVCSFSEAQIHNDRGATNGGGALVSDVPSADRGERARADVSDDPEFDPFADWQNSPPVKYPEVITEPCCKCAYLMGRSDKMIEMHRAQDVVIQEVIEKASR